MTGSVVICLLGGSWSINQHRIDKWNNIDGIVICMNKRSLSWVLFVSPMTFATNRSSYVCLNLGLQHNRGYPKDDVIGNSMIAPWWQYDQCLRHNIIDCNIIVVLDELKSCRLIQKLDILSRHSTFRSFISKFWHLGWTKFIFYINIYRSYLW